MYDSCCQLSIEGEIEVSENLTQTCEQYDLTSAHFLMYKMEIVVFALLFFRAILRIKDDNLC